jgi:hypothetical protein
MQVFKSRVTLFLTYPADFCSCLQEPGYSSYENPLYSGALWKKLSSPFHRPHLTSHNSIFETSGDSRAARAVGAALEPPGFSPGVSKME